MSDSQSESVIPVSGESATRGAATMPLAEESGVLAPTEQLIPESPRKEELQGAEKGPDLTLLWNGKEIVLGRESVENLSAEKARLLKEILDYLKNFLDYSLGTTEHKISGVWAAVEIRLDLLEAKEAAKKLAEFDKLQGLLEKMEAAGAETGEAVKGKSVSRGTDQQKPDLSLVCFGNEVSLDPWSLKKLGREKAEMLRGLVAGLGKIVTEKAAQYKGPDLAGRVGIKIDPVKLNKDVQKITASPLFKTLTSEEWKGQMAAQRAKSRGQRRPIDDLMAMLQAATETQKSAPTTAPKLVSLEDIAPKISPIKTQRDLGKITDTDFFERVKIFAQKEREKRAAKAQAAKAGKQWGLRPGMATA